MKPTIKSLSELQSTTFDLNKTTTNLDLSMVLSDRIRSVINENYLYLAYNNVIPNSIEEQNIDCRKANEWFIKVYKDDIKDVYFDKRQINGSKKSQIDDIYYFLFDDLMVSFDTNCGIVKFLFRKTDISKIEAVLAGIHKNMLRETKYTKAFISLLYNGRNGIDTQSMELTKRRLSITENYNDDFENIHKTILKRLSKKNDKGLVLLQGKPGTGKTSYIRYLISKVRKKVIFLPPNLAGNITNPDLIAILIRNPNSILVIEDAENLITNREMEEKSPVSALLNLSDGLLSDCLNIQIICSFNTAISKIDTALLRKGRLIAKYEFNELSVEKAQRLSFKLGYQSIITKPTTLTDIYNQEEQDFVGNQNKRGIGFEIATAS